MAKLFAYTDGACSGNPGPGGWGVVMEAWEGSILVKARDIGGGEADTTNNLDSRLEEKRLEERG